MTICTVYTFKLANVIFDHVLKRADLFLAKRALGDLKCPHSRHMISGLVSG